MSDGFNKDEQLEAMQAELSRRDAVIRELRAIFQEMGEYCMNVMQSDVGFEGAEVNPAHIVEKCKEAHTKTEEWKAIKPVHGDSIPVHFIAENSGGIGWHFLSGEYENQYGGLKRFTIDDITRLTSTTQESV
jgi:hypothetical protein